MKLKEQLKQNENLIRDFFSRVWGPQHELEAIDELMTEDYCITTGGKVIQGREHFKEWVRTFQERLTEAKTISQEIISSADGTTVVSRWICTGKNNGIFDLPPNGKPVAFTGIAIWRVQSGKLAECWVERSALEVYQELKNSENKSL